MTESRFARIEVKVRRDVLEVTGQQKTRRGQYFGKDRVQEKLEDKSAKTRKKAQEKALKELFKVSE